MIVSIKGTLRRGEERGGKRKEGGRGESGEKRLGIDYFGQLNFYINLLFNKLHK